MRIVREAKRRLDAEERPPLQAPDMETLRDRLQRPQLMTRWRIDGWLPMGGRSMLVAQYKAGKTTLIGNLVRSLVDANPFLGVAEVASLRGTVALIDTEMSSGQLDEWLRGQAIVGSDRLYVVPLRGRVSTLNLLDPSIRAQWAGWLRTRNVEFLILDCLRPVLDALGLDEQHDVGRLLVAFDALLSEAGVSEAVIVHHMGHSGERARGDSRLRDWPDVEWRLVRQSDDPGSVRYIRAFGRDVDVPEQQLGYDASTRRLSLTGNGSRQAASVDAAVRAVLDLLAKAPEALSVRGIQAALEHSDHSRKAIREAIKRGVRLQAIVVEQGPRNSLLHRLGPVEVGAAVSEDEGACQRAEPCR